MIVTFSCDCAADEEHEIDIDRECEPAFKQDDGDWQGFDTGEKLPCGHVVTQSDVDKVWEVFHERLNDRDYD